MLTALPLNKGFKNFHSPDLKYASNLASAQDFTKAIRRIFVPKLRFTIFFGVCLSMFACTTPKSKTPEPSATFKAPATLNSFADIKSRFVENKDYKVRFEKRPSRILALAIHGGRIEPLTSELALDFAGKTHSYYLFEGLMEADNRRLHLTSTRFDDPVVQALAKHSDLCVSFHGYRGDSDSPLCIGGGDSHLVAKIMTRLTSTKALSFIKVAQNCEGLEGVNPENIVNQCQAGGIQLEFPKGLRERLNKNVLERVSFIREVNSALLN